MKCKYCGGECRKEIKNGVCDCCRPKAKVLPRFVKARDDLREKLGLERFGG